MAVHLQLLETAYSIDCDRRWSAFLSDLWRPFVRENPPRRRVQIEIALEDRWVARVDGSPEGSGGDPWRVAEHLRHFLVDHSLRNAPRFLDLHAAVVSRGSATVLLAGPSATGKTTLTLSFLERGWTHLSDDVAPIDRGTGRVLPFPKPVSVRSKETWERLTPSWDLDWPESPTACFLLPAWLLPLDLRAGNRPTHLVFPRYVGGQDVRVEPLSPAAAASRCGEYLRKLDPPLLGDLIRLCRSVKRAGFTYGDSDAAAGTIETWLGRVQ